MKTPAPISIAIFFLSVACFYGTAGAARPDPARAAIAARSLALMTAIEKGDAASVAELFAPDATLSVPLSGGVIRGRADIATFWRNALGGGLKRLVLTAADVIGNGDLRVESGTYQAFGADGRDLGRGQYLLAWVKEGGVWKIARDFAHGDAMPVAMRAPQRAGLPDYATQFRTLGETQYDDRQGLTTVYANDRVAESATTEAAHYPDGSVILMEFAEPQLDGENQLLRDARGRPLKGRIAHIDVMRRGTKDSGSDDANRAGEWTFASYLPDGTMVVAPTSAAHCAACHLKAGAEKDFVFRLRSWEPAGGTMPGRPNFR